MVMEIFRIRKFVSIPLLILWILTGVSGILMRFSKILIYLGYTIPTQIIIVHVYAGLLTLALATIHIALNWDILVSYMKPKKH